MIIHMHVILLFPTLPLSDWYALVHATLPSLPQKHALKTIVHAARESAQGAGTSCLWQVQRSGLLLIKLDHATLYQGGKVKQSNELVYGRQQPAHENRLLCLPTQHPEFLSHLRHLPNWLPSVSTQHPRLREVYVKLHFAHVAESKLNTVSIN